MRRAPATARAGRPAVRLCLRLRRKIEAGRDDEIMMRAGAAVGGVVPPPAPNRFVGAGHTSGASAQARLPA